MKQAINITLTLLTLLGLLSLISCTDLVVAEKDSLVIESEGGTPDPGDPVALLEGLYNQQSIFTDQANLYSLQTHTSDEMIPPTRGVDWGDNGVWRTLHSHTWDPTHSYVLQAWNGLNQRAFVANQILAAPSVSPQGAAEAKFLRALHTYLVMDLFGQVPFRAFGEGADVDPRVLTRTEAFDAVIKDLQEAIPDLPSMGPSAENTTANKAAAYALMARVYLNKGVYTGSGGFDGGDMDQVIAAVDNVTAEGYSLEANYFDNFSTDASTELILASPSGSGQNRWMMTLHYSQNPSGWNGFTTLADFYDKFSVEDQRTGNYPTPAGNAFDGIGRGFLIGQQYADDGSEIIDERTQKPLQFTRDVPLSGAATDKGIRAIKYHPANAGKYVILRYGEAIMNKAEALLRKGDAAGALVEVNALRAVRGATALASIDEAGMLDERGRELYWEGHRRPDQIRFGTFTNTWPFKDVADASRVLFPIPQQALDSNPNLTQNDGY